MMVRVAGIRFKKAGKVYYFDPDDLDIKQGTNVIVETARGLEFGNVTADIKEVPETQIIMPLKKVIRIADQKDETQYEENTHKKARAIELCLEKVAKHKLEMKLIDVEYTFDNSKIIFYFTSDGRVDFRELVKDLASVFKMRIELRQIGVRDESKMMGGIGSCGKGLCCNTWLPDFEPVSIKMAKVQNLSLNPTKISGVCGRLMCCLKYENDIYLDLRRGMPEHGEKIKTVNGTAVVMDVKILENLIKSRLVIEEKTDEKPEKLSSEFYFYKKEDIERLGTNSKKPKREKDIIKEIIEEEGVSIAEVEKLLKE